MDVARDREGGLCVMEILACCDRDVVRPLCVIEILA